MFWELAQQKKIGEDFRNHKLYLIREGKDPVIISDSVDLG